MSKKIIIEKLLSGESIKGYKESGNSMTPLIKHRQPIDLDPVDATKLEKGDIVLVKVKGNIYTHKVSGVREGQVQISNNKGRVNGWTALDNVYGIVTAVDGKEISSAKEKIKSKEGKMEARDVIGLTIDEALEVAKKHSMTLRTVREDGVSFIVTRDYRTDRINLTIEKGIIVDARIG